MTGEQVAEPNSGGPTHSKQNKYTCICCRIKFDSADLQRGHFKTEWHSYNLKRRVCNLDPIDLDSFVTIQAAAPPKSDDQISTFEESVKDLPIDINAASTIITEDDDDDEDGDWEEIDGEEMVDLFSLYRTLDDEEKAALAETSGTVIRPNTCLFCDKKSPNTGSNVTHMNLMHSFFIPEEQYLIDLDGLMEYLCWKVGAIATCLWCSKQFSTVHGARLHMIYKEHCKIYYDQDKALEEFGEFYDYSTQEHIRMKPLNELAIPKKRSERRAEHNQLVKSKSSRSDSKQLVAKGNLAMVPGSYQAKNIKLFNAYKAKILLRTGMANNNTMRGRLRQQNPM